MFFKKIIFLFLIILIILSGCKTLESDNHTYKSSDPPAEYQDDEFPNFLKPFRRAEIIFAGCFPLAMMFTNLGTFTYTSTSGTEIEDDYLDVKIGLAIAGGVALTDFILGLIFKENEE